MHNAAFAEDGVDYAYVAMDVSPEGLERAVDGLAALGFVGFNVTMPHKENIIPLLDGLDEPSRISGAVNTVVVRDDGLLGMNTDGSGFVEACEESGVEFAGKRVLLLGAGGASAAVSAAIVGEKARGLVIANRTLGRAETLVQKLTAVGETTKITAIPLSDAAEAAYEADAIVNTTYLGMRGNNETPVPVECLEPDKAVCDAGVPQGV